MTDGDTWLVERVTRLLDVVTAAGDDVAAGTAAALDELVVSLGADLAAVVGAAAVPAQAGPAAGRVPPTELIAATTAGPGAEVAGLGSCDVALGELQPTRGDRFVVLRSQGSFSPRERHLVRVAGRVVGLSLVMLDTIERERAMREESDSVAADRGELLATLTKRHQLLDNLGRIERSISQRTPLGELLSTITDAVSELLGDELVALRLLDPEDPRYLMMVADRGIDPDVFRAIRRTRVGEGTSGLAVAEDRLVVVEDYQQDEHALEAFAAAGVRAAMSAPVHEGDRVVGSITVATYDATRTFSALDQETLLAFAEHVSLALTDARTQEAMRDAMRAKDNLLAMVSHELKTPLTVIMGVVQTMQRHAERLPDHMRDEMLASAQERGHELERLIDRLLQGARGEPSGALQASFLPTLVSSAVRPYGGSRRIDVQPVPSAQVEVDTAAVQNALGKLLENAVSHSPEGTTVTVSTELVDDVVSVTVTNTATLSAGTDVSTLFAPFQRGAEARSPGVGLGLFIAGRLATALGGSIEVAQGADTVSFTLTFPVRPAPRQPEPRPSRRTAHRRGSAGPRR